MSKSKQSKLIAWIICGIGALFYAYEYLLRIIPSVMEPMLREHFSLSAMGFGVFASFYYYSYVPMQLPVGVLMDRFGPRRLLTLACAISILGMWFFAATNWVSLAAAGRFLTGFGSAFAFVGVLKLATIWLPEDRLALVSGLATALGTLGAMIGDNVLGSMVESVGWRQVVNGTALVGLVLLLVLWFGVHDKKQHLEQDGGTVNSFSKIWFDVKLMMANKQIWMNGAYGCLVYLPTTVFAELWGIPYLSHAHGLSVSTAEFANSILFFGCMFGAPLWGFCSDSIKQRVLPMRLGAFGAFFVMSFILYFPHLPKEWLYCLMFLLGLLYSAQAIVFAVGRELSPKEAGATAIAMTNMFVMLGAIFLQPLVGHLLDWCVMARDKSAMALHLLRSDEIRNLYTAADYQIAMAIIPVGILTAAILTFFIKETHAHAKRNPK